MTKSYCDAYNAGFNKGYEKAKKEMRRQVLVTSDGKIYPLDAQPQWTPCDWCKYNPPSSMDGKPCTICPAVGRGEAE